MFCIFCIYIYILYIYILYFVYFPKTANLGGSHSPAWKYLRSLFVAGLTKKPSNNAAPTHAPLMPANKICSERDIYVPNAGQ